MKLFVPSNLAAHYDEQGTRIPVNRMKKEVENAAQDAGIPMTIVLPGNFAEFALGTPYVIPILLLMHDKKNDGPLT